MDVLNAELRKLKANNQPGNPVTNVWMNANNTYAIIELRSVEETQNAFILKSVSILEKVILIISIRN